MSPRPLELPRPERSPDRRPDGSPGQGGAPEVRDGHHGLGEALHVLLPPPARPVPRAGEKALASND